MFIVWELYLNENHFIQNISFSIHYMGITYKVFFIYLQKYTPYPKKSYFLFICTTGGSKKKSLRRKYLLKTLIISRLYEQAE